MIAVTVSVHLPLFVEDQMFVDKGTDADIAEVAAIGDHQAQPRARGTRR